MSLAQDLYAAFKKVVSIEDLVSRMSDEVKQIRLDVQDHAERLARLEGKFELLEHSFSGLRRKLPSREKE
jgi:hypothetical protein